MGNGEGEGGGSKPVALHPFLVGPCWVLSSDSVHGLQHVGWDLGSVQPNVCHRAEVTRRGLRMGVGVELRYW